MEYKELLGRRRTIRYYQTWRPVEKQKIQKMLEAARRASHAGNLGGLRAVVVDNTDPPEGFRDAITGPGSQVHGAMAPVVIIWYVDMEMYRDWGDRLKQLIDAGALNATHGWSYTFAENFAAAALGAGFGSGDTPSSYDWVDAGLGICQAMLMAYEEGLGVCLNGFNNDALKKVLKLPSRASVAALMTVGYPAESWEAGGQRPKRPFEDLFSWNEYGKPFPKDPEVDEELRKAKMIYDDAPLPWRKAEVRALAHLFGLPE